jgi:hypothetical protein
MNRRFDPSRIVALLCLAAVPLAAVAQTSSNPPAASTPNSISPVIAQEVTPPRPGAWTLDPGLAGQLDKPRTIDEFTINPPAGFKSLDKESPDGAGHTYEWTMKIRPNGTQPELDLAVAIAPKDQTGQFTPASILATFVDGLRGSQLNWKSTETQKGSVNSIPFMRQYWAGIDDNKGFISKGFVYVSEPSPGKFLIVDGRDAEPDVDTDLPLLEAAALTCRQKGAPAPAGAPK